jgi:nucleoside-diphosphate-sugar epimerase/phosphohistidine swiveling domain-containing protein
MRIVVTGASGDFGACIVPELLVRGHEVHGVSRGPHEVRSPNYRHTRVDVRDSDALAEVISGADAVVHLAWTTHPSHDVEAVYAVDIGGTQAVLAAMERSDVDRLIAMSSVMAYGANADNPARLAETDALRPSSKHVYSQHKARAEELIEQSELNALCVRATNIMGRDPSGATREGFATPVTVGMKDANNFMQFIHPDDLARFVADAVEHPAWTGPINLAAADTIHMRDIAAILGKRYVEFNPRRAESVVKFLWDRDVIALGPGDLEALVNFPLVDTRRLSEQLAFRPAWTSRDCVADFRRANREHIYLGAKRLSVPGRWPWARVPPPAPELPHRHSANDAGAGGEFDTTVDPNWSIFTAFNTSEAFPGPMSPLALELSVEALRAGGATAAEVLRLDENVHRVLAEEQVGVFGHGIYANLSSIYALNIAFPGTDASSWESMLFGQGERPEIPELKPLSALDMAARMPILVPQVIRFPAECRRLNAEARTSQRSADYYRELPDERLFAELRTARDEVANGWSVAGFASALIVPVMALIEKRAGRRFATQMIGGAEGLASAGLSRGAHELAAALRADLSIGAAVNDRGASDALAKLRIQHPAFTAAFDAVMAEYGHRGPRETELSNPVFADTPERLLDVVKKLATTGQRSVEPISAPNWQLRLLAWVGNTFQQAREMARDATIRYTHNYRLIARETGVRLARQGIIQHPDDVFYLVRDELAHPPADARETVARRRAERIRLSHERPPLEFSMRWEPEPGAVTEMQPGATLTGTPVSAGVAKGVVRVLTPESTDDFEPGEILVTRYTDVGWTPFFSYAAAVVVDTGGEMSHAAVVAREFGVPCVVGSVIGSEALRTGHVVEVDGSSGLVTRVE